MLVKATLKNQEQFVHQFAQQVQGKESRCLNANSVIFPDETGQGGISYISHSHFSFIISNVILKEEMIYNSQDEVGKSEFVDFGLFADGRVESSFLTEHQQFRIEVPNGVFQHFSMNIPLHLIPKNKSRKELLIAYERFADLHFIQTSIKSIFNSNLEGVAQTIAMESKALNLVSGWLNSLQKKLLPQEQKILLSDYEEDCVLNAKSIIKENFSEPPTIKQLSRQVGINQLKLKHGFKELFDITIRQYAIYLRMEKAKELLEQTDISIQEVCHHVGYNHQGHFASIFKRFYGVSPLYYKNNELCK